MKSHRVRADAVEFSNRLLGSGAGCWERFSLLNSTQVHEKLHKLFERTV